MAYQTGLDALKNAITEGKARSSGGPSQFSNRLEYFAWKAGDTKIIRFLTDDLVVGDFADRVLTNTGKAMDFFVPDADNNILTEYGAQSQEWGGNLIPLKLVRRGVGVAVLRDEKPLAGQTYPGGGQKTELVDYTYQKDVGGTPHQARWFGVIKQSPSNFWDTLIMGSASRFGTLCDRDYSVTRIGGDKDTKYSFVPLDPVEELRDPEAVRAFYGYGKPWDQNDPNRFLYCPQTLPEWVDYYGGRERVEHWLAPKNGQAPAQTYTPVVTQQGWASPEADEPQAAQPATGTSFDDLRSKLLPHLGN